MRDGTTAVELKFAKILTTFESLTANQQNSVLKALTAIKKSSPNQDPGPPPPTEEKSGIEARQNDRASCSIEVSYTAGDHFFSERIKNISGGGLYIETPQLIAPGEKLSLTFSIPNTSHNFKLQGVVVRSSEGGIGVQFESITEHQKQLIDYIVNDQNRT